MNIPASWLKYFDSEKSSAKSIEVEIISNPPPKDSRQIVREAPAPESQKTEDNAAARFLSAQKQRVLLETQAKITGQTKNRALNKFRRPPPAQEKDFSLYKPMNFHRALTEEGLSTVGEALPTDLSVGSFTALNTDQYQFYSFFARVEDLVRFRWEAKVKSAIETFERHKLLNRVGNKNWITQAVFLLNPEGRLQKVLVLKESGVSSFDAAVIDTFKEVLIFPNPPKEMIESDGLIHLKYSFNVHFSPNDIAFR